MTAQLDEPEVAVVFVHVSPMPGGGAVHVVRDDGMTLLWIDPYTPTMQAVAESARLLTVAEARVVLDAFHGGIDLNGLALTVAVPDELWLPVESLAA